MPHKDPEARRKYHREYYHLSEKEKSRVRYTTGKKNDPVSYMLRGARSRAKKKGLDFSLDREDVIIPDFCPVLQIPLVFNEGGFKDNSPSLDRINNALGYIPSNVQVISYKANAMKSSGSFEDIEKLYYYMKEINEKQPF